MKVYAMKKFDRDLAALGARVMEMGTLAQSMVSMARLAMTAADGD